MAFREKKSQSPQEVLDVIFKDFRVYLNWIADVWIPLRGKTKLSVCEKHFDETLFDVMHLCVNDLSQHVAKGRIELSLGYMKSQVDELALAVHGALTEKESTLASFYEIANICVNFMHDCLVRWISYFESIQNDKQH